MPLCEVCRSFDATALFQRANSRADESFGWSPVPLTAQEYHDDFIPQCFKHHDSLAALKEASNHGCHLCTLIWQLSAGAEEVSTNRTSPHMKSRSSSESMYRAQIYIGCKLSDLGPPIFFVERHCCELDEKRYCVNFYRWGSRYVGLQQEISLPLGFFLLTSNRSTLGRVYIRRPDEVSGQQNLPKSWNV